MAEEESETGEQSAQELPLTGDGGALARWFERGEDEEAFWSDLEPGPPVAEVASRLSSVPRDFLHEQVCVVGLTGDILGYDSPAASLSAQIEDCGDQAGVTAAALALWLWASEDLLGALSVPLRREHVQRALAALAYRLAPVAAPIGWVRDPERREEAARGFLLWSGQLPGGEDPAYARNRFESLDSLRRDAQLRDALAVHQHRLEVTRKLQEAAAKEAAARPSPE